MGRRGLWRCRQGEAESKTRIGLVEERAVSVSCLILESIRCLKVSRGCPKAWSSIGSLGLPNYSHTSVDVFFFYLVFVTLVLAAGRLGLLWNISIVVHFYPKWLAISLFSLSSGALCISCIFRAEYICCIFSSAQANGCFTLPRIEVNQVG